MQPRLSEALRRFLPADDSPESMQNVERICTSVRDQDLACVKPGFEYYISKLEQKDALGDLMKIMRALRLFNPRRITDLELNDLADVLQVLTFFDEQQIRQLCEELLTYLNVVRTGPNLDRHMDISAWWRTNAEHLPKWYMQLLRKLNCSIQLALLSNGYFLCWSCTLTTPATLL